MEANPAKYVDIANEEAVFITKNGKKVAKITGTSHDKVEVTSSGCSEFCHRKPIWTKRGRSDWDDEGSC
jgi:antitoxin (DNA-binding transcriptional repressor) of toxin-antitoxin stability system